MIDVLQSIAIIALGVGLFALLKAVDELNKRMRAMITKFTMLGIHRT